MKKNKSRFWHIKDRRWYTNPKNIAITGEGNLIKMVMFEGWQETEEYVPSRYIGLEDSNGKEIHEGDIVEFNFSKDWLKSKATEYLGSSPKKVVYGLDGGGDYPFCGFSFINLHPADLETGEPINCIIAQCCKIVGNIFENPELLEN